MQNQQIPQNRVKEKEAAEYLGMSVPFLRLTRMGRIPGPPYYKIGKSVRYDIRDLDKWLASQRVECR